MTGQKQRRIHHDPVQHHTPVEVRPGDPAGGAHRTQWFASGQGVTWFDLDGAQVAIHAEQSATMVKPDCVAVEEIIAGIDHNARSRRLDRRAGADRNVEAGMRVARQAVEDAAQAKA